MAHIQMLSTLNESYSVFIKAGKCGEECLSHNEASVCLHHEQIKST